MNRCYECESELTLVCQNCNTRPTPAPCDELVTVAATYLGKFYPTKNKAMWPDGAHELVPRQNAEEVIENLKNEVAEKDARIKELEAVNIDAGKVEGGGCKRCDGKGEIVVGKGRHGDTIIEDCPSCTRSQAEELLAAERMKLEATARVGLQLSEKIDALEAENKRLREALEPFADVADLDIGDDEDDRAVFWPISNERFSLARRLRVGDLRRASKALGEVKP